MITLLERIKAAVPELSALSPTPDMVFDTITRAVEFIEDHKSLLVDSDGCIVENLTDAILYQGDRGGKADPAVEQAIRIVSSGIPVLTFVARPSDPAVPLTTYILGTQSHIDVAEYVFDQTVRQLSEAWERDRHNWITISDGKVCYSYDSAAMQKARANCINTLGYNTLTRISRRRQIDRSIEILSSEILAEFSRRRYTRIVEVTNIMLAGREFPYEERAERED